MRTFPDWLDPLYAATVGDELIIPAPAILTVSFASQGPPNLTLAAQPRSVTGVLSERAKGIEEVVRVAYDDAGQLLNRLMHSPIREPGAIADTRVRLKNILENYRSALDYAAHYAGERCVPPLRERDVQFPIDSGVSEADFITRLRGRFPGLESTAPEAFKCFVDAQEFNAQFRWLRAFNDFTNQSKHRTLLSLELRTFSSLVIRYDGVGVRFGDLGLRSLRLHEGARLQFVGRAGVEIGVGGPQLWNSANTAIPGGDGRIEIVAETRNLNAIPGHDGSLVMLLWLISKNTLRTVDGLCRALS